MIVPVSTDVSRLDISTTARICDQSFIVIGHGVTILFFVAHFEAAATASPLASPSLWGSRGSVCGSRVLSIYDSVY
jgi:hypothetical protein